MAKSRAKSTGTIRTARPINHQETSGATVLTDNFRINSSTVISDAISRGLNRKILSDLLCIERFVFISNEKIEALFGYSVNY